MARYMETLTVERGGFRIKGERARAAAPGAGAVPGRVRLLLNDLSVIASQLAVKAAKREGDSWRKVTTVDIPGVGPAARTQGIEDIAVPGDALNRTIRAVLTQTYIPVPGQEGKAITSTFRFTG
jgi:hypothetical protein